MAPTGTVLTITLLILGVLITLAGLQLLVAALLPRTVREARGALTRHPWWSALTGAGLVGVTIFGVAALGIFGPAAQLFRFFFVTGIVVIAACGLAALARIVGERMPSAVDETSPWRATLRGVVVSELAFLSPVPGWVLFAVALLPCGGAGVLGAVRAFLTRRAETRAVSTPPIQPPAPVEAPDEVGVLA